MSTETTNKKIKIDNGTTFGKTYTDKAVDELLKGVGGSDVGVIEVNDSQAQTLANNKITFTAEQAEIIKTHQLIVMRYGNVFEYKGIISKILNAGQSVPIYTMTMFLGYLMFFMIIDDFGTEQLLKSVSFPTEYLFDYNSDFQLLRWSDGDFDRNVYLSKINGTPIAFNNETDIKNYQFTEDKSISLFGKHSILVPKDSADSNIDLYVHSITIGKLNDTFLNGFTFLFPSSSNLVVDSIQDLNTLLGTTSRMIPVSGCYNPGTPVVITRLNWKGSFVKSTLITTGGEEDDILATFTSVSDDVTTL